MKYKSSSEMQKEEEQIIQIEKPTVKWKQLLGTLNYTLQLELPDYLCTVLYHTMLEFFSSLQSHILKKIISRQNQLLYMFFLVTID